jgi:hypothetical protein
VLTPNVRGVVVAPLVALTLLAAPAAYALQTASTAHTGAIPTAGPTTSGFGRGGAGGPGGAGNARAGGPPAAFHGGTFQGGTGGTGQQAPSTGGGQPRGLGGATSVSTALTTALATDADRYTWAAATTGDNEAASLELASGAAVMSLGGYNGTDPAITLAAFEKLVAADKIHYYIADAQGFIGSTAAQTSTAYQIQQWVESTFTAQTIGSTTVYDLTSST